LRHQRRVEYIHSVESEYRWNGKYNGNNGFSTSQIKNQTRKNFILLYYSRKISSLISLTRNSQLTVLHRSSQFTRLDTTHAPFDPSPATFPRDLFNFKTFHMITRKPPEHSYRLIAYFCLIRINYVILQILERQQLFPAAVLLSATRSYTRTRTQCDLDRLIGFWCDHKQSQGLFPFILQYVINISIFLYQINNHLGNGIIRPQTDTRIKFIIDRKCKRLSNISRANDKEYKDISETARGCRGYFRGASYCHIAAKIISYW